MKLLVAIVKDSEAVAVSDHLVEQGFRVTRIASTGGFLRRGNVTLLIGVEDEQVEAVIAAIDAACAEPEGEEHKATIFVLPAEHFFQVG